MDETKKTPAAPAGAAKAPAKKTEAKPRIVLDVAYQPQVRTHRDTRSLMLDVIIGLLPVVCVSVWQYGFGTLLRIVMSVCSAVFFEWGYRKLTKKEQTIDDLSAAVTGLLMCLTLSPAIPIWLPIVGNFFAIVVVKQLYGGLGKNFLNPALAGRAFLAASYASYMSRWTVPNSLKGVVDGITMATPLAQLYDQGFMPNYMQLDNLLFGTVPGAMGELSALAVLLGGIWLLWRRVISWRIPTATIGTVAILTLMAGHEGFTNLEWMSYNVLSGGLLLAAFFMATDYSTSPVTPRGMLVYGVGIGALTVLIRRYGGYPEGVSYAVLLMNLCSWALDKAFHRHQFGVTQADLDAQKAAKKAAKEASK